MKIADRRKQIMALRKKGLLHREIADTLGLSRSHVHHVMGSYEKNLVGAREAKRRRTGVCVDCGAETRYNGTTVNGPSLRCKECADDVEFLRRDSLRGTFGKTHERLQLLQNPTRFMMFCHRASVSKDLAGAFLDKMRRYGLVERPSRGVYVLTELGRQRVQQGLDAQALLRQV